MILLEIEGQSLNKYNEHINNPITVISFIKIKYYIETIAINYNNILQLNDAPSQEKK